MLRPWTAVLIVFARASTSNRAVPSTLLKQSDVPILNAPDEGKDARPVGNDDTVGQTE
jgi:hypothetical protein